MFVKDNKGYTLVELILSIALLAIVMTQIGNIMISTSTLYKKGNMEVALQSDAQQLIQQFEEIVVDCDKQVLFDAATQTITINNDAAYLNSYVVSLDAAKHEVLLTVNTSSGSATQLMAENVTSIWLDKTHYDDASKVVFSVQMDNGEYHYSASKDIYFRNSIGSNDNGATPPPQDAAYIMLNILRFKTYDLTTAISPEDKTKYNLTTCEFEAPVCDGGISVCPYEMPTSKQIKCTNYFCGQRTGTPAGNYVYFKSKENPNVYLKCYSEDVCFGYSDNGTYGISPINADTCKSNDLYTYITATGISLEDCKEFTITPMLKFKVSTTNPITVGSTVYKYVKVTDSSGKVKNPPCEDLATSEDYNNLQSDLKEKAQYYEGDLCVQLYAPHGSGSNASGTCNLTLGAPNAWSNDFCIYLAEGYDSSSLTAGTEKIDLLKPDNFKTFTDVSSPKYKFAIQFGDTAFEIDPVTNSMKVDVKMFKSNQAQGIYSISSNLGKFTDYCKAGGELFLDIRLIYNKTGSEIIYDCKGVIKPTCTETGSNHDTCRSKGLNSDSLALSHFNGSFTSGMSVSASQDNSGNWTIGGGNNDNAEEGGNATCTCSSHCPDGVTNPYCEVCKNGNTGCTGGNNEDDSENNPNGGGNQDGNQNGNTNQGEGQGNSQNGDANQGNGQNGDANQGNSQDNNQNNDSNSGNSDNNV